MAGVPKLPQELIQYPRGIIEGPPRDHTYISMVSELSPTPPPFRVVTKDGLCSTLSGIVSAVTGKGLEESGRIAVELAERAGLPVYSAKEWARRRGITVDALNIELLAQSFKGDADKIKFVSLKPGQVVSFEIGVMGGLASLRLHSNMAEFTAFAKAQLNEKAGDYFDKASGDEEILMPPRGIKSNPFDPATLDLIRKRLRDSPIKEYYKKTKE